jgi:hypothetical protein
LAFHMLAACLLSFLAPTMATADQALIQDNGDGNGVTVGAVAVTFDESSITVSFTVDEPYRLLEAHAAAAADCDDIPQTGSGNPKVGKFEASWKSPDLEGADEIPLTLSNGYDPGSEICIAAHAVVYDTDGGETVEEAIENTVESAWADGEEFPGKSWATHFPFTLTTTATCPCDFAAWIAVDDPKWQPEAAFEWFSESYGSACKLDSFPTNGFGNYNYVGAGMGESEGFCAAEDSAGYYQEETLETLEEFYACSAAVNAYAVATGAGLINEPGWEPGPCPTEPDS